MIRSTRRDQKAAATKALVITTARKVFTDRGYADVTIRDLATAIGMSTGAIFAHFSGKDALWHAAMKSWTPDEAALVLPVLDGGLRDAIKALEAAKREIEPNTMGWFRAHEAVKAAKKALELATYPEPKEPEEV